MSRYGERVCKGAQETEREYRLHPAVLRIFPLPTTSEIQRTKERVALYKRHGVIEAIESWIVTGFVEYSACKELGIAPEVTGIDEPRDVVEYIVRRNLPPADYDDNARGCVDAAVLAHKHSSKVLAKENMREGGRRGGRSKGKGRDQSARPFGGDGERWFKLAARTVGVTPGLVRSLDRLLYKAPDVFEMVRDKQDRGTSRTGRTSSRRSSPTLSPVSLCSSSTRGRREEEGAFDRPRLRVLAREGAGRTFRVGVPMGRSYIVHTGSMQERAEKIPDASMDIVFADPPYGRPDIAEEAAKFYAAKKLRAWWVLRPHVRASRRYLRKRGPPLRAMADAARRGGVHRL